MRLQSKEIQTIIQIAKDIYGETVQVLSLIHISFSFTPKDSATVQSTQEIMATVSSPRSVANAYRGALSIEPTSKSTTIAQISVKSTHTQRGMDFINKLVEVYNRRCV